jgi:hypothetical protein
MKWQATRGPLKHLGTLHGRGELLIGSAGQSLGQVTYEIDGFARRTLRSDNGQIEGPVDTLAQAFRAGVACIVLADGQCVDIVLSDPRGGSRADVRVKDRFPQFDHAI